MMKKEKPFISISKGDWEEFIATSCERAEVSVDNKGEYAIGFIKGVQVFLLDLLAHTSLPYEDYRDDVAELERRLAVEFGYDDGDGDEE